jgi:hypothetical protein
MGLDPTSPRLDHTEGVTGPVEVRRIHPFQARKTYLCPGCSQEIRPGVGHVVVVPRAAPDLRRHWHRSCWERRDQRHSTRGR